MSGTLHPSEHRAYRELYASAQHLAGHWSRLVEALSDPAVAEVLESGAVRARELIGELSEVTPRYGLYGEPAARGVGARIASGRTAITDRFLERNQAMRLAVLDAQHVTTLLGYLAELAETRGDESLAEMCSGWERRMRRVEQAARRMAVGAGRLPDSATERTDRSKVGAVAHGTAQAVGTLGEWVDRRIGKR